MKKRITALVLSVLVALSLLPNAAYAAEADTNTIKLERFGMSGVAYNSAALGRCTLHQMYYDYGGTTTVGFCGEKGKGMGNSLIGQTWGNRQEISDPIVNMMMAYYYAHSTGVFTAEAEALGVDTLWDAGYTWYMNAWVQAIVWRYKEGTLTDPVESCAEELMAVWNSLQNANYTTIDDKADGTSFRDRTQYIIDLGNRGIWGECSVYEYTFTGAGSATHPANMVQSVMIGELNVDVTQESYSLTVKKVDVTNPTKGLPGAKFHIEAVNGSYSKDMTTGADGTFTLTPLVAGTYAVTEVAAPSGYKIDNAGPEYVVLPNNGSNAVTMTFTDTPIVSASGSIRKVDADDPTHGLAGAVIKIEGIDNNFSGSYTTGAGGALVGVPWDSMPIGSYTATEVTPPEGYYLSPDPDKVKQTFYWDGKADVALTFENDSKVKIQLEKLDDAGNPLTGAVFNILKDGQIIGSKAVNAAGILTVTGVTEGLYAFVESHVPKGFQKPMEPTLVYVDAAEIQGGGTIYATAVNQSLPGLRIVKYERGTMKFMEDVTFEIFRDAVSIGTYQTNRNGEILLTDLEPGTYLAVERDTGGDGHVLTTTPQQVELKAGDGIKQLTFFNDRLPGIHLIKVDSGDLSKTIPNARFRFEAVDGSYGPVEYTTSDTGTIDLSKLPVGAYVVTELDCPGYVIDNAQRIIQLDGNEQAQFIFTNSKLPSLHLYKESADGSPLGGVSFRLAKIEDGSFYLDRTTSSTGEILWENLEPGVYSLREISTVSDHILDLREYHIELFPGKVSTKMLQNNQRPNLTIWKFDADDTKVPVEGATFLVEYADGHSIAEVTTGKDGSVTIENLLPSVVKITEKSVPSPYLLDAEPQLVTLYPNRDRDVYFYNHKAPSITIIKEDSITHERLENVKFRVYYASNKTSSGEFRDLGVYVTDEQGEIHLSRADHGLEDGWFRVVELEPKIGYAIKDSDTQDAFVQSGKSKTFLFENTPLSALVIWKFDNKNSAPLSANFQLKYLGGTSGTGGTVIGTYTTSPVTGSVTITGLKAGTYIVEELAVNSPDHVVDSAPQTVYISGENQDVVQVHFGNAPKGSLLITKKSDKGEPLAGVEFMVTDSTGAVVGDANGKFWSNSAGEVLISGILPGTTLIARETKGLDSYVMDDVAQTAVIQAGQTVTLEFINAKKGNLIVQKYGIQGDKKIPLEGVEFKITYADGKFVDTEEGKLSSNGVYFTNKEGQIVLSNVVGTIVATEVASVPGYTIDPNTQTQTVVINAGDDTQTLYFYNQPVGGVEITKVNAADKTERIETRTSSQSKGHNGSYSQNFQQAGRELMTPDEVRMLDNRNAIVLIRGEAPVIDQKYDLMRHPNIQWTGDGDAAPYVHHPTCLYDVGDLDFVFTSLDNIEILE